MNRFKALTTALVSAAFLSATAAAHAAPPSTQAWDFDSCSGPAGTPTSFSTWRAQSVGNALHLVDGSGTFVVLYSYNEDLGVFNVPVVTPGMKTTAMVQCSTIGPLLGFHLTVWGHFGS
jgi:hypothetical protein